MDFWLDSQHGDPDNCQSLITCLLFHSGSLHKISLQSVYNFLNNIANIQTDRKTDKRTSYRKYNLLGEDNDLKREHKKDETIRKLRATIITDTFTITFHTIHLTLTLPGPSAGVSISLDSYCSIKPLCLGMGEVVPARTSPTLHPPSPRTVLWLPCLKCPSSLIVVTSTLRVKKYIHNHKPLQGLLATGTITT